MSLPTPLPADLNELDDGLPDPTPEEIAGLLDARAALARGEGIPLDEVSTLLSKHGA
jgi:predicted amino acid racemase